ncbi:ATP-dependent nuclease [Nakamurella multipartita]|uniref:ATP-dependent nuclease n=1 Tax=Nakamurella multipartita TaxID=53461 RepID=UPI0002D68A6F|nr:AAA family ATPase [Nakamurella multipartita]
MPADKTFFCLIGPGDSSKTTLLEAIHLALTDRWNLSINDTDFYDGDTSTSIIIRVTVSDLPAEMLQHSLLGFHLSGVNSDGEYQHDPQGDFLPCVIIQLKLSKDVEPSWTIFRPDHEGEFAPIGAGVRRRFDVFKADDRIDIQLRWSKASALSRLTDSTHGATGTLAAAVRAAREAVFNSVTPELQALTGKIQDEVNKLGTGSFANMRPGLDNSLTTSGGNLALFEGNVPMTNYGLGTRRLAGIATQQMAVEKGAVLLIDEIEHGLEPHRLVHLLRHFAKNPLECQIFVTTHSSIAVEQLQATDLVIVRSSRGEVDAKSVSAGLEGVQAGLRAGPSAFLARRIVVAEGKTEHGLLLGLTRQWDETRSSAGYAPLAALGSTIQDGRGGSTAPTRAKLLQGLGYSTALFVDHDDPSIDNAVQATARAGSLVVRWEAGLATEDQLVASMDASLLTDLLVLAGRVRVDEETVIADLNRVMTDSVSTTSVSEWLDQGVPIDAAREGISKAAKKYKWFKTVDDAIILGEWVHGHWPSIVGSTFESKLSGLRSYLYFEDMPSEGFDSDG